ncbi:FolB-domain-containing protein, partial [Pluteus cervinus]
DSILIDTLHLSANIGLDCWRRSRAQPIGLSVYLLLPNGSLNIAGLSDDVEDSVHYGDLTKAIVKFVEGYEPLALSSTVTSAAAGLTPSSIQVRVVLHLPKYILLSPHFSVEVITPSPSSIGSPDQTRIVEVRDLDLPVIIGVNPPERQMKQRVKMTLIFREILGDPSAGEGEGGVDYRHLIADITKLVELSAYLTLERFVYHIVQHACTASPLIQSVTVRAQKPSAIAFAESSGVEITRSR